MSLINKDLFLIDWLFWFRFGLLIGVFFVENATKCRSLYPQVFCSLPAKLRHSFTEEHKCISVNFSINSFFSEAISSPEPKASMWPVGSQVFWADGAAQRGPPCISGFSWGYFLHHASVLALGTSLLPMPRHSQWHGEDREPPFLGSQVCEIYRRNEWSKLPLLCCCFSSFSHHTHQPLLFSLSSEEPSCALFVHSDKEQPLLPHMGLPSTPDDPAQDCFAQ